MLKKISLVFFMCIFSTVFAATSQSQQVALQLVKNQNVGEDALIKFLNAGKKGKKVFTIYGYRIGIIFNPKGSSVDNGVIEVGDPICIISEPNVPDSVFEKIVAKIPPRYSYSSFSCRNFNGKPIFEFFGFE